MIDKTCLSYWFPVLEAAGLPVPKTIIVKAPDLSPILDGESPKGFREFIQKVEAAIVKVGCPAFLRTGHTSGKHYWNYSCFMDNSRDSVDMHVAELVEFSATADFIGLPCEVWAVREMLPTAPICFLPAYRGFPLVREARCFIDGGKVVAGHPYWPDDAIIEGFPMKPISGGGTLDVSKFLLDDIGDRDLPGNINDIIRAAHDIDWRAVTALANRVAVAFKDDEPFSVDLLQTKDGSWWVTDMALTARSFRWKEGEVKL